jgi:Xaa-Pro dipeptidase
MRELLTRLRERLSQEGIHQAVLSHPETLAHLSGFEHPFEDWPVADPFTAAPALLFVTQTEATLVVPQFYASRAESCPYPVVVTPTHDFIGTPPDAFAELAQKLLGIQLDEGPTGVEAGALPLRVADLLRARGVELVPVDTVVVDARRRKLPIEIEAIRRASRLADIVQQTVKDAAEPGMTEAELAGVAQTAMYREVGRRVPSVLVLTTGEATARGGDVPGERMLRQGDLLLADATPWIGGAWSDTANTVAIGKPTNEQRRIFDAVRGALEFAIELCRPGVTAGEIDREVRESLAAWGTPYTHHTGHGIGAAWNEPPLLIPESELVIEEEMVLSVEPGIYRPGWGGIRLEHVFVVRAGGNEILTQFEHTL